MDENAVRTLMSTIDLITTNLDAAPDCWRDHLQPVRSIIATVEFSDSSPDEARRQWQVPLINVLQRVAYMDADHGGVPDVANWCLRQALTLLQVYPEDVELLAIIGQNWLLRAQKSLSKIHQTERDSSSSGGSLVQPMSPSEEGRQNARATVEAENLLHTSDYVEARGILLPAVEYLKHAVDAARAQNKLSGRLLSMAAESYMSLGNVSSTRVNQQHFHEALGYLRTATEMPNYSLPSHLQTYLDEYGPLDDLS